MRVVVANVRTPFIYGGGEVLADELVNALRREGHEADLVSLPFNPGEPERIPDQMLAARLVDLREIHGRPVDRLIALKFPAYLIPQPNKVLWLMHQHRAAYEFWDHPFGNLAAAPRGRMVRDIIRRADQQIADETRALFTISRNVSRRLLQYSGIESTPLYHPPSNAAAFYCAGEAEDYFYFPSRLSASKRQELVVEALAHTRNPVCVKFAGLPDSAPYGDHLKRLVRERGVEPRVVWTGFVTEEEKREAYARSLAVIFPPVDEDYGYITLEAMLASKAVITCEDSGGPLEFVVRDETGLVTSPTPGDLAQAMDALWDDRTRAKSQGAAGRKHYDRLDLSWSSVLETLLA
jgi:glycosyltransferase involved in cell wall biosynthesis